MNTIRWLPIVLFLVSCQRVAGPPTSAKLNPPVSKLAEEAKAASTPVNRVKVGNNVYFENQPGQARRVWIPAEVCFREGPLELLLCKKWTKEHEAILSAEVDGREVHAALLAAGAKVGTPVQFVPSYKPASGTPIKVTIEYEKDGKTVREDARQWIRDEKSGQPMAHGWVFAGSRFFEHPEDKSQPKLYAANGGDLICVSNFESAMLDVPVNSPEANADLQFEANTKAIPPVGTRVWVGLEIEEKK